ncbi:MAG TPA: nitroreductase family protein [Euryarchaeota archaeon]|nr:nitroreductase family protein [Euryarchaeota archaeon]
MGLDLREAISSRRSIRSFSPQQVDRSVIDRILLDANKAPSAGNLQARDFIVVTAVEVKKKIAEAALNQAFIAEAPVVVVVCANKARSMSKYGRRGANLYSILDAALAAQNLMLSCINEGLGSCYVGAFNEGKVRKILGLPKTAVPVGIIPIGYPDENPIPTDRLPIEQIVHWEEW